MLRFLLGAAMAGVAMAATPAAALRVVPIVIDFAPRGGEANQVVRVENETAQPIAVQMGMFRRAVELDGKETLEEADDDFIVFPPQLVLLPGENRAVRIQFIGDPAPAAELAYRMVAEQLPVDLGESQQGARVRIVIRYEGAAYIVPPGARPDIVVEGAAPAPIEGGGTGLALTVRNNGTKHALLNDLKVNLRGGGRQVALSGEQLPGMTGQNILAGNARRFVVPWPAGLPVGGLDATLEYRAAP